MWETVTNQNYTQDKINKKLNLENMCYHSVQDLLFLHIPSTNLNTKKYNKL
jgi:hypothetical protein